MAFLGMCATKRGCKRLSENRKDKRKLRNERKMARISVKGEKVDVDKILAEKGIDSRSNRVSATWKGISSVTDSVGRTVSSIGTGGKINPYAGNLETALQGKQGKNIMYVVLAIVGAVLFKIMRK